MRTRILWVGLSFLLVASLVLSSCGPAEEEEEEEEEAVEPADDTPQYGGTLTMIYNHDADHWDYGNSRGTLYSSALQRMVLDVNLIYDWARGPAGGYGTDEFDYTGTGYYGEECYIGAWVESWEHVDLNTVRMKVKQDVHYGLNPNSEASRLVNGRVLTVDDIIYNFERYIYIVGGSHNTLSWAKNTRDLWPEPSDPRIRAQLDLPPDPEVTESFVKEIGPWEIELYMASHVFHFRNRFVVGYNNPIHPPELIEKYGNVVDWRNVVGTGPFMIEDLVSGVEATFIRNPNHWQLNPVGPGKGDRLPYLDELKVLMILDPSTRLAALRTAQADWLSVVPLDDAESVMQTHPQLEYTDYLPEAARITWRCDTEPFSDIRVRQAMHMAIDFDSIVNDYYRGQAEPMVFPFGPERGYVNTYIWLPMEAYSDSVQELFSYNTVKARQLLEDAGIPDGFKIKIDLPNSVDMIDRVSVLKEMWADVGIDLELAIHEMAVYEKIRLDFDEMKYIYGSTPYTWASCNVYLPGYDQNISHLEDYWIQEQFEIMETFIAETPTDPETATKIWREEILPHAMENIMYMPWPQPYEYVFWWPWVRNYSGELNLNQRDQNTSWPKFVWIDEDLRESMK